MGGIRSSFLDQVGKLAPLLDDVKGFVGDEVCETLYEIQRDMPRLYENVMNENRDLKLGIVGRVKAGKSSFLNALLFNGEEWLPKAATPMTAALTRITYTEGEAQMIVHYYFREEWNRWLEETKNKEKQLSEMADEEIKRRLNNPLRWQINREADEIAKLKEKLLKDMWDEQPIHVRAAMELTRMAKNMTHDQLPGEYKDSTRNEKIASVDIDVTNPEKLRASIHKYVGAGGEYTPFVSYIELRLNDERIKGVQIVDTPGLDDPVASRIAVTDKFLKECDAALLLSSVSHFLGAGDSSLLKNKMQDVARAYIVGTMMDAGVLEYPDRRASLQTAYSNSRDNYIRQASEFLGELRRIGKLPGRMGADDEPEFVSSMFYGIAQKLKINAKEKLNDIEKHVLSSFEERFRDFHDVIGTVEDFENFAAMDSIYERVYMPINKEKEEIKKQRIMKFEKSQALCIARELEYLSQTISSRKEEMQSTDAAEIRNKIKQLDRAIDDCRADIMRVFDMMDLNVSKLFRIMINNIGEIRFRYDKIDDNVVIEDYVEERGIIFKDYIDKTRKVRVASTPDAAKQIGQFAHEAKTLFDNNVLNIMDAESISREIMDILQKAFQMAAYTPPRGKVESIAVSLVKKLQKPSIDFGVEEAARKTLLGKFTGQVRGSSVDDLKAELGAQLLAVNKEITRQIEEKREEIAENLQKFSMTFCDNLQKDLNGHYHRLEKDLTGKEESLAKLDSLLKRTGSLKSTFMTMAGN